MTFPRQSITYPAGGDTLWLSTSLAGQLLRNDFFGPPAPPSAPRLYYAINPASGWVAPTAAEIIAGTGFVAAGSELAPTVTTDPFTFAADATGLTNGVSYRIAYVWSDGALNSNVAVSDVFVAADSVTTVSAQQPGEWSINALVSATLAGGYEIVQAVSQSQAGSYGIAGTVSNELPGGYGVAGVAGSNHDGAYAVLETVGQGLPDGYAILATVNQSLAGAYAAFEAVGVNQPGAYSIAGSIGQSQGGDYAVFAHVGAALPGVYSALNTVGRSQAGAYEIFVTQGFVLKVYTSSGWIDAPLRIWDGSSWVRPTISRWSGTGWEIV